MDDERRAGENEERGASEDQRAGDRHARAAGVLEAELRPPPTRPTARVPSSAPPMPVTEPSAATRNSGARTRTVFNERSKGRTRSCGRGGMPVSVIWVVSLTA